MIMMTASRLQLMLQCGRTMRGACCMRKTQKLPFLHRIPNETRMRTAVLQGDEVSFDPARLRMWNLDVQCECCCEEVELAGGRVGDGRIDLVAEERCDRRVRVLVRREAGEQRKQVGLRLC